LCLTCEQVVEEFVDLSGLLQDAGTAVVVQAEVIFKFAWMQDAFLLRRQLCFLVYLRQVSLESLLRPKCLFLHHICSVIARSGFSWQRVKLIFYIWGNWRLWCSLLLQLQVMLAILSA